MSDVMQLGLRHFCSSPGHAVQDVGIRTAGAFRVGEVPEGGRLQFLADAFEVHSISILCLIRNRYEPSTYA